MKEETLHVISLLKNKIIVCNYEELELLLSELVKIPHSSEITEILCESFVATIQKLEKLGILNKYKNVEERVKMIIKALSKKSKDMKPCKLYNKF